MLHKVDLSVATDSDDLFEDKVIPDCSAYNLAFDHYWCGRRQWPTKAFSVAVTLTLTSGLEAHVV